MIPRSPENCRHDMGTTTFADGDVCCDGCGNPVVGESLDNILAAVWQEGYEAGENAMLFGVTANPYREGT